MKPLRQSILFFFVLVLVSCGSEKNDQVSTNLPQTEDTAKETPKPNITRKSAQTGLTEDYTNTNRVIWQKPNMVIDLLGSLDNKTVADIGAGTGYFALRMVPKAKKVIAIDIDQRFVQFLDSIKVLELPENLQSKLEARLGTPTDARLQNEEADIVIIVNTYMYIKNQVDYLTQLKNGISEGGKLLIIDFKKKRTPIGPPSNIRTPLFTVEDQLYEAGYKNVSTNDTALDYQYIIMAEK